MAQFLHLACQGGGRFAPLAHVSYVTDRDCAPPDRDCVTDGLLYYVKKLSTQTWPNLSTNSCQGLIKSWER